jgi:hypothetical protein
MGSFLLARQISGINMKEEEIRRFKVALTKYLNACQTRHLFHSILPIDKLLDLRRHIIGLLKKRIRRMK